MELRAACSRGVRGSGNVHHGRIVLMRRSAPPCASGRGQPFSTCARPRGSEYDSGRLGSRHLLLPNHTPAATLPQTPPLTASHPPLKHGAVGALAALRAAAPCTTGHSADAASVAVPSGPAIPTARRRQPALPQARHSRVCPAYAAAGGTAGALAVHAPALGAPGPGPAAALWAVEAGSHGGGCGEVQRRDGALTARRRDVAGGGFNGAHCEDCARQVEEWNGVLQAVRTGLGPLGAQAYERVLASAAPRAVPRHGLV